MTTYYVDTANGSDSNAGTSEGSGNAWKTIQKAMNTLAAGDQVYVKATGNYNEQVDTVTTGSSSNPVRIEGYTTTVGDDGQVTIDGQSTRQYGVYVNSGTGNYYEWRNFTFKNATTAGFYGSMNAFTTWINCRAEDNGGSGFVQDNNTCCVNCTSINNSGLGFDADSKCIYIGNVSGNNTDHAYYARIEGCESAYKNVAYGLASGKVCFNLTKCYGLYANTMDADNLGGHMFSAPSTDGNIGVADNVFYDGGNPMSMHAAYGYMGYAVEVNNLINSCGSRTGGTSASIVNEQTGAPGFEDEANDDYTPGSGSNLLGNGVIPGSWTT